MKTMMLSLYVVGFLAALQHHASACSCLGSITVESSLDQVGVAARIQIRSLTRLGGDPEEINNFKYYRATVRRVYQGRCELRERSVLVKTGGNSALCGIILDPRTTYVLFGTVDMETIPNYGTAKVLNVGSCQYQNQWRNVSRNDRRRLSRLPSQACDQPKCCKASAKPAPASCGRTGCSCCDGRWITGNSGPSFPNQNASVCRANGLRIGKPCDDDSQPPSNQCGLRDCGRRPFGGGYRCPDGETTGGYTGNCIYSSRSRRCAWERNTCPRCNTNVDCKSSDQFCSRGECRKKGTCRNTDDCYNPAGQPSGPSILCIQSFRCNRNGQCDGTCCTDVVNCFRDPCDSALRNCRHRGAVCATDYCGACRARVFTPKGNRVCRARY